MDDPTSRCSDVEDLRRYSRWSVARESNVPPLLESGLAKEPVARTLWGVARESNVPPLLESGLAKEPVARTVVKRKPYQGEILSELRSILDSHHELMMKGLDERMTKQDTLLRNAIGQVQELNSSSLRKHADASGAAEPAREEKLCSDIVPVRVSTQKIREGFAWSRRSLTLNTLDSPVASSSQKPKRMSEKSSRSFMTAVRDSDVSWESGVSDVNLINEQSAAKFKGMCTSTDSRRGVRRRAQGIRVNGSLRLAFTRPGCVEDLREKCSFVVHHGTFDIFFGALILFNSLYLAWRIEVMSQTLRDDETALSVTASVFFTTLFAIEMLLRIISDGWDLYHYRHPQVIWNVFDSVLVIISIIGVCGTLVEVSTDDKGEGSSELSKTANNARLMRLLRLIRLIKIFRMVRILRFAHSLRVFVISILGTLVSLFWALVLLFILFYFFGAAFTVRVTQYLIDAKNSDEDYVYADKLKEFYGSLPRSIFTLFMCISGGIDWREAQYPLHVLGAHWVFAFVVFLAFCMYAVLNVLTGVFCQNAIETASHNEDVMIFNEIEQRRKHVSKLEAVFSKIDDDGNGALSLDELKRHINDNHIQAVFDDLEVDYADAETLFKMLAISTEGAIEAEDFVAGLMQLKGGAKRADVLDIKVSLNKLRKDMKLLKKSSSFASPDRNDLLKKAPSSTSNSDPLREAALEGNPEASL